MGDYMRKQRGQTQALYLIETIPSTNKYIKQYDVMGSTGNVYNVSIKTTPSCSCPDYTTRHRRCKHIYFILIRVMHVSKEDEDIDSFSNDELEEMFSNIPDITQNLVVDSQIKNKYKSAINRSSGNNKDNKVKGKDTDDLCPICLDDLENGDTLDYCKYSCGKYIHKQCFEMWSKKMTAKCVFCRESWTKIVKESEYINLIS